VYALLIGMVPLLSFGIFFMNMAYHVLKDDIDTYHAGIVREKRLFLQYTMGDVENLIANLSGNEDIKDVLLHDKSADSTYNKLLTQAKIGYILSGYTNLTGLVSIDIFSNSNVHYHVGETLDISKTNIQLKDELCRAAELSKSNVYWSGIERNINLKSEHKYVINAVKLLYGGDQGSAGGPMWVLIVSYDINYFNDFFKYLGDAGYYIIVDPSGHIIYHPETAYVGQQISTRFSDKFTGGRGNFIETLGGEEYSVNYEKLPESDWTIASITPLRAIYQKIIYVMIALVALLVVCLVVAGVFAVFVSRRIVFPIKKVTDTFTALQHGDIGDDKKLDIRSNDEIGQLGTLFNSFIDARKDILVQKALEKKLSERNEELQATLQELQHTQGQLIQQEKLAGIGQLAAGVAHEINNPMGFIISNLVTLRDYIEKVVTYIKGQQELMAELEATREEPDDEKRTSLFNRLKESRRLLKIDYIVNDAAALIRETRDGADRVKNIVQDLKGFARTEHERKPASINVGLESTINIIWNEIKYKATLVKEFGQIPTTLCNIGQLNQVFMNILVNAAQAINKQGEIRVKTWVDEDNIFVSIADTGGGIAPEILNRIFEPFFTTKDVGKGTGLGLSVSYDIIRKHGGTIKATSEVGKGTTFTITIPIVSQ